MRRTVCYITVTVILHYYPFVVRLDRYIGSCNTLNDLSNKVCVTLKTEDLHIHDFNMIIGKNESKTLRIHISCECKCKYDQRKSNSNQKQDNSNCQYKCKKNIIYVKKIIFGIVLHVVAKMENI